MPWGFTAPYHSYEYLRRQADAFLAKRFDVSSEVVERRLQKDGVQDTFKQ